MTTVAYVASVRQKDEDETVPGTYLATTLIRSFVMY